MTSGQRGAQWLAHEQQDIGADDPDAVGGTDDASRADDPPRFPFTYCMSSPQSLARWFEIVTDAHFGS